MAHLHRKKCWPVVQQTIDYEIKGSFTMGAEVDQNGKTHELKEVNDRLKSLLLT